MADNKFSEEKQLARCEPMSRLQSYIAGKWKILILWYISFYKVQRFGELMRRFVKDFFNQIHKKFTFQCKKKDLAPIPMCQVLSFLPSLLVPLPGHAGYFTVTLIVLYTPFWAYTYMLQVPFFFPLTTPFFVTVATAALLLS